VGEQPPAELRDDSGEFGVDSCDILCLPRSREAVSTCEKFARKTRGKKRVPAETVTSYFVMIKGMNIWVVVGWHEATEKRWLLAVAGLNGELKRAGGAKLLFAMAGKSRRRRRRS
jgi:hypothetical protein